MCHLAAAVTYLVQGRRLRLTRPTRHALTNGWTATALLVAVFTVAVRPAWNHVHPATCQVLCPPSSASPSFPSSRLVLT